MCGRSPKKCVACENESFKMTPQGNYLCKEHWEKFSEMVLEVKPPTEAHGFNPDEFQSIEDINDRTRDEAWWRNRHGNPPPARNWSVEDEVVGGEPAAEGEAGRARGRDPEWERWDRTPNPDQRSRR